MGRKVYPYGPCGCSLGLSRQNSLNLTWQKIMSCDRKTGMRCEWDVRCMIRTLSWVTRFVKIICVELDLAEDIELGRREWDVGHGEEEKRVVPLVSSTRHIELKCVTTIMVRCNAPDFLPMKSRRNSFFLQKTV